MPYLGCDDCGKTFYTARREPGDERCAECGGELSKVDEVDQSGDDEKAEPPRTGSGSGG